jgi:signal transduction histidine kinase
MQAANLPRKVILLALCLLCHCLAHAQTTLIQSEQRKLPTIKDSAAYVNCLNRIGLLYHMKSPDSCFSYGFRAKAMANRLHYINGEADADNNIAIALYLKGLYRESLALFGKISPVFRRQADTVELTNVFLNMSTVYMEIKDPVKAVAFCRNAIYTGKNMHRDSCMSVVYANYCIVNQRLSEDSAQFYLAKSKQIATRYHDQRMLIVLQQLTGLRLLGKGLKEQALPYIKQSLQETAANGMEYLELNSLGMYASYYSDKPDSILAYYNRIYQLADTKGYDYLRVKILNVLVYYYGAAGHKEKQAAASQLLITALNAENENMKKFIGDYVKYNDLENDNLRLALIGKSDRIKIGSLIVVCIVVSLLILMVYRLYRASRKQEQRQVQLNTRIQETNLALQQADEFKNRLVSILAHDFRTPLISTIGIARLMKESHDFGKADVEKFYDDIENEVQTMLRSFDTILQWIRQQLTGYQYQPEELDLHHLFTESAGLYTRMLETKSVIITNFIPADTTIMSDKEMLQFINRNLLSNAIRFSPDFGIITIRAVQMGNELVVSVEDEGPGMTPDTIDKLFLVSNQPGRSTQHGAGIALSMCRDFIQKLGGRIWAENRAGKGAVFFYAIPFN